MFEFIPFFIVLIAGLFFSELFLKYHVPWVISLIIGGIIIGPSGFNIFESTVTLDFLSKIGLVFLMFMAGLESNLFSTKPREGYEKIMRASIINTVVPFVVGVIAALALGFSTLVAVLVGVIFSSTSVAILIPTLEAMKLLRCGLGRVMVNLAIINDVVGLVLLSLVLNWQESQSFSQMAIFLVSLTVVVIVLNKLVPKIIWFFEKDIKTEKDLFQQELRTIMVILIGIVILFQLIGLDPVVSGFFAGIFISRTSTSEITKEKMRTIGYGLFIPIFFVTIGASVDLFEASSTLNIFLFAGGFAILSAISKYTSGLFGALSEGFSKKESRIIATSTIPQLSVPLAVAITGLNMGFFNEEFFSIIILGTMMSTLIGPILMEMVSKNYVRREVEPE